MYKGEEKKNCKGMDLQEERKGLAKGKRNVLQGERERTCKVKEKSAFKRKGPKHCYSHIDL